MDLGSCPQSPAGARGPRPIAAVAQRSHHHICRWHQIWPPRVAAGRPWWLLRQGKLDTRMMRHPTQPTALLGGSYPPARREACAPPRLPQQRQARDGGRRQLHPRAATEAAPWVSSECQPSPVDRAAREATAAAAGPRAGHLRPAAMGRRTGEEERGVVRRWLTQVVAPALARWPWALGQNPSEPPGPSVGASRPLPRFLVMENPAA